MDAIEIRLPDTCCLCNASLDGDTRCVVVPETALAGLEIEGDPTRLVGWCGNCAPDWAK